MYLLCSVVKPKQIQIIVAESDFSKAKVRKDASEQLIG
jgi:hypothetical protein